MAVKQFRFAPGAALTRSVINTEVLIGGAGPAGSVAAALLAREGKRVTLIDPQDDAEFKIGETLPQVGVQLLERLGLPVPQANGPHQPIDGVRSIWGDFDLVEDALSTPGGGGWRLDRTRFDQDLRDTAQAGGSTLLNDFIRDVSRTVQGFRIRTAADQVFHAETVIDATGRRAGLARRLGATQTGDAPWIASWALGESQSFSPRKCRYTLIETVDEGWWYGTVLPNGAPLAIFHSTPAVAAKMANDADHWRKRLADTRVIRTKLPVRVFKNSCIKRADARGLSLDIACGENWYACGDAALSFNPLASQGLFNAISTAATAAKLIQLNEPYRAKRIYQSRINSVRATYCLQLQALENMRIVYPEHQVR